MAFNRANDSIYEASPLAASNKVFPGALWISLYIVINTLVTIILMKPKQVCRPSEPRPCYFLQVNFQSKYVLTPNNHRKDDKIIDTSYLDDIAR